MHPFTFSLFATLIQAKWYFHQNKDRQEHLKSLSYNKNDFYSHYRLLLDND